MELKTTSHQRYTGRKDIVGNKVEDDYVDAMAKEIAKEIDDGIMSTILVETGWTPVTFFFKNSEQAVDIQFWLAGTCQGKYRRLGSDYLFENKQDAEWFILRWS